MKSPPPQFVRLRRRVIQVILSIAAVLAFGTAGYEIFADYPVFDAFYMALTTITTIGYGELHPMSRPARVWNVVYISIGVTTLLTALGALTQSVIELELSGYFQKRRTRRMIDRLENHYIVCGFGRVGRSAAAELVSAEAPFLIVDRSEDEVEAAIRLGYIAVAADCTRDETLRDLGIARAQGLIAALATDADNLYLILTAKTLNPQLKVATRVSEEDSEPKLRRAGADVVFAPFAMTGHRLSQSLLRPHVNEFIDFATGSSMGLDVRIEQVRVSAGSPLDSKSLRQASKLRTELGIIVLAIRRADGLMLFNPSADCEMSAGDYLIAMGPPAQLRKLESLLAEKNL